MEDEKVGDEDSLWVVQMLLKCTRTSQERRMSWKTRFEHVPLGAKSLAMLQKGIDFPFKVSISPPDHDVTAPRPSLIGAFWCLPRL